MEDIPENDYRIDDDIRSKRLVAALVEVLHTQNTAGIYVTSFSERGRVTIKTEFGTRNVGISADLWREGIVECVLEIFKGRGYWTDSTGCYTGRCAAVSRRPFPKVLR